MKKYLLIMKRKRIITYEVYDTYSDMLKEASFIRECIGKELTYRYYRIDNMDSKKIFKILLSFTDYIKEATYGK